MNAIPLSEHICNSTVIKSLKQFDPMRKSSLYSVYEPLKPHFSEGTKKKITCSGCREARVLPACRAISVCCSTVGPGGVNNTRIRHVPQTQVGQIFCFQKFPVSCTLYLQVSLQRRRCQPSSLPQCL